MATKNTKKSKDGASSQADVWRLLGELTVAQKRTEAAQQRTEAAQQRTEAAQQRTEAAQQRTEAMHQQAELARKKLAIEVAESRKRSDAEFDRVVKQMDKRYGELQKSINQANGNFNRKWGHFLESLVAGDFIDLMAEVGVKDLEALTDNYVVNEPGTGRPLAEFDLISHGNKTAVGAEVKMEMSPNDVDKFIEALTKHGRRAFRGHDTVHGAFVFLKATRKAQDYAMSKGLILIKAPGGKIKVSTLINPKGFQPKFFPLKK